MISSVYKPVLINCPLNFIWSTVSGLLYAVLITGVITDAIKNATGRPRPNFFWRCFPDGVPVHMPSTFLTVTCFNTKIAGFGF